MSLTSHSTWAPQIVNLKSLDLGLLWYVHVACHCILCLIRGDVLQRRGAPLRMAASKAGCASYAGYVAAAAMFRGMMEQLNAQVR